jgi:hypothetical protein
MEAKDRDAPLVHHGGIELGVALVVRDLLAAAREADRRAVIAAIIVLQLRAVPAGVRIILDSAHESVRRRSHPAADLDVVAAREVELLVVEPPGHVDVHTADAVLVVRHVVDHGRDVATGARTRRVGDVLADHAAGVGETLRKLRRLGVEEQSRGLERARREHHGASRDVALLAAGLVDVRHSRCQPVAADGDFARHRVGEQREPARRERRCDEHVRAREVRLHGAAAVALAAVVAGLPPRLRARDDREA